MINIRVKTDDPVYEAYGEAKILRMLQKIISWYPEINAKIAVDIRHGFFIDVTGEEDNNEEEE